MISPPDFVVNGDIAVEVRRLNLMVGDENKGLESVEKPLDRDIYSEWWLVLAEYNVNPVVLRESDELQILRNNLTDTSLWSRIIFLSNLQGVSDLDLI